MVTNIKVFAYEIELRYLWIALIVCPIAMSRSRSNYFSIKDGLSNPKQSLSSKLASRTIAFSNNEVMTVLQENSNSVKCQHAKYNR